ncbi:MAG: uroporphyrinogen decarboxylase family protein [Bullifex sp.]
MTNKERVINAIEGRPVDHVPMTFSIHFPKAEAFGDAAVASHLEFYEETGVDIMKIMNENLVPQFEKYHGISSWGEMPAHGAKDRFICDQLELIRKIMDKAPDGTFFLGTLHGTLASMIHPFEPQIGYENVRSEHLKCFRENRKAYEDGAKRITETMIILIEEMAKLGVDGIYYASLGAEKRYFTDEEFEDAIAVYDRKMLEAIRENGMYSFLHMCKDGLQMNRYAGYAPYADVVNWGIYEDTGLDLEAGRKMFPGKTIMGGLANRKGVIVDGNRNELLNSVRNIVSQFGKDRFIFGADCTLPTEIPYERLRWIKQALSEI